MSAFADVYLWGTRIASISLMDDSQIVIINIKRISVDLYEKEIIA